jgi:hypothetical protein
VSGFAIFCWVALIVLVDLAIDVAVVYAIVRLVS